MTIKSIPDDEAHLKIMRLVQTRPTITQREIAVELGVSLGKVNFLLNALIGKGAVKVDNFRRSNNKLAYAYLLTPSGIDDKARLTVSFLKRKLAEYEAICQEIDQLECDMEQDAAV